MRTGIGSSRLDEAEAAGKDAAARALERLGGAAPALVMVHASIRYDLAALLAGVRQVTGVAPLVGASTNGHFHEGEVLAPGEGVSVLVLTEGPYRFGVASAVDLAADPYEAGRAAAAGARDAVTRESPFAAAVVLSCGTGDQQALLDGVHRVAGASVPLTGGVAGDDRYMRETYVLHDGEVLGDAVAVLWIASETPLSVVHGHGWSPLGTPQMVTDVEGTLVRAIGGRPAGEVFAEGRRQAGDALPPERRGRHSAAPEVGDAADISGDGEVGRCFGVVEPDGSQLLRSVYVDAQGDVHSVAPLPPYCAVQIMSCTTQDLLEVCEPVVLDALAPHDADARRAGLVLTFDCVARSEMLGDRVGEEAGLLQRASRDVPVFGFYTYGEFARTSSSLGFHNATLTAIAL